MKILLIALALFSLSACSFRGWDPPNHNQSLYAPQGPAYESGTTIRANIPESWIKDFKAQTPDGKFAFPGGKRT